MGAVRAGKTTPAILKVIDSCQSHPGIQWLIARWTQDATDAQLEARFRELCSPDILVGWNAQEQYFEIVTEAGPTSRIYARGLKPSEDAARYSKFAGVTLAGIYVDHLEEMPEDFFVALQRTLHVDPHLPHNPETPLLEGWDFGHGHPCVVWAQFVPWGALHVLGGVMGASMFIEDFCPEALLDRAQWFPGLLEVRSTPGRSVGWRRGRSPGVLVVDVQQAGLGMWQVFSWNLQTEFGDKFSDQPAQREGHWSNADLETGRGPSPCVRVLELRGYGDELG